MLLSPSSMYDKVSKHKYYFPALQFYERGYWSLAKHGHTPMKWSSAMFDLLAEASQILALLALVDTAVRCEVAMKL